MNIHDDIVPNERPGADHTGKPTDQYQISSIWLLALFLVLSYMGLTYFLAGKIL